MQRHLSRLDHELDNDEEEDEEAAPMPVLSVRGGGQTPGPVVPSYYGGSNENAAPNTAVKEYATLTKREKSQRAVPMSLP